MPVNEVFNVIKRHCQNADCCQPGSREIDLIKDDLELATSPLEVYLLILKNMNLVEFSLEENGFIKLTELGKRLDEVPYSVPSIIV